jgi:hypothetical protein
MEKFFRRVEVYTEEKPPAEMMDIIIEIMVQVLSILAMATKELKENSASKYPLYKFDADD